MHLTVTEWPPIKQISRNKIHQIEDCTENVTGMKREVEFPLKNTDTSHHHIIHTK